MAPYHTLQFFPSVTSPMTLALGATKAVLGETEGVTPSTATKRVEGTRRSEYLTTSMDLPMESRDWPSLRAVLEAARTRRAPRELIFLFEFYCIINNINNELNNLLHNMIMVMSPTLLTNDVVGCVWSDFCHCQKCDKRLRASSARRVS